MKEWKGQLCGVHEAEATHHLRAGGQWRERDARVLAQSSGKGKANLTKVK